MRPDAAIQPARPQPSPRPRGIRGAGTERSGWRVALFVAGFPVRSETFVVRQVAGLREQGHQVDIFADWRPAEHGEEVQPEGRDPGLLEGVTYMDMPTASSPWELPAWPPWGRTWVPGSHRALLNVSRWCQAAPHALRCLLHAPRLAWHVTRRSEYGFQAQSLSSLYRLSRLCRASGPYDVLHAHFGPVANSFRFARERFRAPLVATFHGYDFTTVPREQGRHVYEKLFQVVDAVTVNSQFARSCVTRLGCPPDRVHLLPMGVDPERFPFQARRRATGQPTRLLTVARLVPIKGHDVALEAVRRLRSAGRDVTYDIVGEGPQRETLRQRAASLDLDACVRFHPACDGDGVRQWMERSHVFILPSRSIGDGAEAQGLVLQEAQASGMPVVGSDAGGIPEGLLPGISGLLFPEGDAEALAARLERLVSRPAEWDAMGRAGRDFVLRRFHLRDLNSRWPEIYGEAQRHYQSHP